ncbi:HAD family hydrolase [Methanofollis fontis]|uniref:HAD family hydrolase n=1 Tax=Methanofollis fontis TaxID=2052832 RepID=UPI0013EE99D0|nr:HAD family hydrolase [Methanofollis fontis]
MKAVLFDMDNTLWDFVAAKREACRAVVEHAGKGDADELFSYFGRPGVGFEDPGNVIEYLLDIGANGSCVMPCCRVYEQVKLASIHLYPGVDETLETLVSAGLSLAVVTDAHSSQARARLSKAGIIEHFACIVTPDISGGRKPDHASFLHALRTLPAHPGDAMVVGDSIRREIEPAHALGMRTAYALYGDRSETGAPICRPDHVLDDIRDLIAILTP